LLKTVDNAHTESIWSIAHSPNRNLIVSGCGGTIKIWDAKTLNLKFEIDEHESYVEDLNFNPTGPFLLSASWDTTMKVAKIALLEQYTSKFAVLLAYLRFSEAVNTASGNEVRKFEKARSAYATKFAGGLLQCGLTGGGPQGVLGVILGYV